MKRVKIFDVSFSHVDYSSLFQSSKYITWDRTIDCVQSTEPIFFTDNCLNKASLSHDFNIGLLLEPPSIYPSIYSKASDLISNFERILTYEKNLLESNQKFEFYPHGGCWIKPEDMKVYPKSKLISMIASEKNFTSGHQLRHKVISEWAGEMDIFGRGYNPIPYKLPALKDFMFSFVIENCKLDYYFTEKLIDCLITGTIPIYYGCPSIHKFFNPEGFIIFDSEKDLPNIKPELNPENYQKKLPYIQENFEKALEYILIEDWIYKNTNIFVKDK